MISVDPESFAALSVLNHHWHRRTNTSLLYSYHLAKCTARTNEQQKQRWSDYNAMELPTLKRLFAKEAKRNLFSVYQQRQSTYRIYAPPTVSASAVPHGEAFSYAFSSKGSRLAVSSSSRLFMLDIGAARPEVTAAFTLHRRPTAVDVSEDGRTLVMLAPEWRINTFAIHNGTARLVHTFLLDQPATAVTLSPDETLLAAAQPHGIEFFALDEVRGTSARRKLACETTSHIKFAENGSFLLGTNIRSADVTTTLVNAPSHMPITYEDEEEEPVTTAQVWLSQPLFPSSFGKTTHASPVPGDDACIFAYDAPAETYGLLDYQKMKFVNSVVKAGADVVCSAASVPSVTSDACLVALPVAGQGVQVASLSLDRFTPGHQRTPSVPTLYKSEGSGDVDNIYHQRWMPLSEKGLLAQWTVTNRQRASPAEQRLTVVGSRDINGKRRESSLEEAKDSGFIHFFDYGFAVSLQEDIDATLDLSDVSATPLEVGTTADDTQQALARKSLGSRTSDNPRNAPLARSVTSAKKKLRRTSIEKSSSPSAMEDDDILSPEERHLDAPYVPSEPRPQGTLQRQRTAAQSRPQRPLSMPVHAQTPAMRDPAGRGEIPDESDADRWVPPPPEYVKETDQELPEELKQTLQPPRIPDRSPRRVSSTPDLQLQAQRTRSPLAAEVPVPQARPRPQRIRTFVGNARNSIMGLPGFRRTTSSLLETAGDELDKKHDSTSTSTPKDSSDTPSAEETDVPRARSRARDSRRTSVLDRPLSIYTQLRPANRRSVSQPLERPVTPPSAFPSLPPTQPESPKAPSPSQVLSLHRRQTSNSISSIRSDFANPPRAAIGAHRRGTNTMPSPWASSLMLNTVEEGGASRGWSRPTSAYLDGTSPSPSRPISISLNGPGPSGWNNVNGGMSSYGAQIAQQDGEKENRPPSRLQEQSLEDSRTSTSRPATAETQAKRKSLMQTRLGSVTNLLSSGKNSKAPPSNVQRSGSRRLQRNGSVRKTNVDTRGRTSLKERFGRFKKGLIKNLEKV